MSEITRQEVLEKKRGRYARAGKEHKSKIINELVELFGYHRKAAIRALQRRSVRGGPFVRGRPKEYDPDKLLPPLKAIWLSALQPCGERLKACLPEWVPAYEQDHRRLDAEVRQALLKASRPTLDRLLIPARVAHRRRATTRPGTLLRQQIPIRTEWIEDAPGFLEMDTVALCGGSVAGDFIWMVDAVDYVTAWVSVRAMWNRGQDSTLEALQDMERTLPFALLGLDSDNGGEFLNHHVLRWLQKRPRPVSSCNYRAATSRVCDSGVDSPAVRSAMRLAAFHFKI